MMGLYTYGTAIGIPLNDLAGTMMSKTARILLSLWTLMYLIGKMVCQLPVLLSISKWS